MKTFEIKDLLKRDLLVVEAKDEKIAWAIIFQKYGAKAVSEYTLLGKADEIREEDSRELVQCINVGTTNKYVASVNFFNNVNNRYYNTATESLLSAVETKVFWENPLGTKRNAEKIARFKSKIAGDNLIELWHKAQSRTFDRNRSIIFVKN